MAGDFVDRAVDPFPRLQRRWALRRPLLWRSGLLRLVLPLLVGLAVAAALAEFYAPDVNAIAVANWVPLDPQAWWGAVGVWALIEFRWQTGPRLGEQPWYVHFRSAALGSFSLLLLCLPLLLYAGLTARQLEHALTPQAEAALRWLLDQKPCLSPEEADAPRTREALRLLSGAGGTVKAEYKLRAWNCDGNAGLVSFAGPGDRNLDAEDLGRLLQRVAAERGRAGQPAMRVLRSALQAGEVYLPLLLLAGFLVHFIQGWAPPRLRGRFDALQPAAWPARLRRALGRPAGGGPMARMPSSALIHWPLLWAARPLPPLLAGTVLIWLMLPGNEPAGSCPRPRGAFDFSELSVLAAELLLALLASLYWAQTARARPLPQGVPLPAWRFAAIVATVFILSHASYLASVAVSLGTQADPRYCAQRLALMLILAVVMAGLAAAGALLAQAAPRIPTLWQSIGTLALFQFASSDTGVSAGLWLAAFAAIWVLRRFRPWCDTTWHRAACVATISAAPLAAFQAVAALLGRQWNELWAVLPHGAGQVLVIALGAAPLARWMHEGKDHVS